MTITFVGHGYVGLVTAAVFAELGNTVWVIGHTQKKIDDLKKGILPIYEPGLEAIVKRNVENGRLLFTLAYDQAIPASEIVFIAVGTPPKPTGEADLSVVYEVAEKISKNLKQYTVVATKSTVPMGTNKKIKDIVTSHTNIPFDIASVPEFLREGQAISDTQRPDRIVIGTESNKAKELLLTLHKGISGEIVMVNIETAEMIKYAANAFLATKISYANAIAQLCEKVSANAPAVLSAIGLDKRIGKSFLFAGAGYGGSCFPKDVKALIAIAREHNYDFSLLKDVEYINKKATELIIEKTIDALSGEIKGKHIAILGLAFKPDTDDMRDAPSRTIITNLLEKGASIYAYDPIAMENAKHIFSGITYTKNTEEAITDADALILVTEWNEFRELNMKHIKELMKQPIVIDARNVFDPATMKQLGFIYRGVGQ